MISQDSKHDETDDVGGKIKILDDDTKINKNNNEKSKKSKTPMYIKTNYACICFYAFLTGTDFALIIPTLWDRLHIDFNASGTFMGLVISAYSTSGVLFGLILGKLSDIRPNKTKIFYLVCLSFSIVGHILYFIGYSKYLILFARAISGLCLGATTVALAYIAKTSSVESRTGLISLIMASRQLGLMVGPAFNLFLRNVSFKLFNTFDVDKKSAPGLFMAIVWSLVFILILIVYKDSKPNEKIPKDGEKDEENTELLTNRNLTQKGSTQMSRKKQITHFCRIEILVLLTTTFFTYFNQTSLETVLIPFTEMYFGWNELHNSLLFCIGGIVIILSYVIIRFLTKKFADRFVLLAGIVCILIGLSISLVSISYMTHVYFPSIENTNNSSSFQNLTDINQNGTALLNTETLINDEFRDFPLGLKIGFILSFVFDVIGLPAIAICSASLFTKLVDQDLQGLGQGVQRGILGIGTIFGPLFAGPFISKPMIILGTCFLLIAFIGLFVLISYRRLKPPNKT